nr:MAG TPA: hypothetical protein [Caudoviricetes sp.]
MIGKTKIMIELREGSCLSLCRSYLYIGKYH